MARMVASAAVSGVSVVVRICRGLRPVALSLAAVLALAPAARADEAPPALILQLDGPAQFRYAGYYAALWKGFYAEAGLKIDIQTGSPSGEKALDPATEIVANRAQFGVGDMGLVVRAGQGMPLLLLAPVFQTSGTMVYSRADSGSASPGTLLKGKVGRLPATDMLDLELLTALRGDGIDPGRLNSVPVARGQEVKALVEKTVDAAPGSAWIFPWLAHAQNVGLNAFNPADYRVNFYGDTIFAGARFAREHPMETQRFRDASLKGWAYALDHPDEIADRLAAEWPMPGIADQPAFARYQADVAKELSRYPEVPLGHSSPERWTRIETSLADAGALVRVAGPDSFIYDAAAPRTGFGPVWRIGTLAGLAALALVALVVALTRRRRAAPMLAALPAPATLAAGIGAGPPTDAAEPNELAEAPPSSERPTITAPAVAMPSAPPAVPEPVPEPEPAPVAAEPVPAVEPLTDLNAVLTAFEPTLRECVPAGIAFRLSLLAELWPCRTDAEALKPLVARLTAEAAATLKPDDTLIVGTRNFTFDESSAADYPGVRLGEFARITVRDGGPGYDEAALERIFDPAATARPAVAAARPAMQSLGGFVRAESAEGVGTAIHLYFARIAEVAPPPDGWAETGKTEEKPGAGRRYKVSGSRGTQRRSRSLR